MNIYGLFWDDGRPHQFFGDDIYGPLIRPVYGPVPGATEEDPNPVAPIVGEERNPAYPEGVVLLSPEVWQELLTHPSTRRYVDGALVEVPLPAPPPTVPRVISDRQFFTQLALDGVITEEEAEATSDGTMPALLAGILDSIPNPTERFKARMLVKNATTFERDQPLVAVVAEALKWDNDRLDKLWMEASQL